MLSRRIFRVARKYGVALRHEPFKRFQFYKNRAGCVVGEGPIIFMGFYNDVYLEEISFFHELGHILHLPGPFRTNPMWLGELSAWQKGLEVAKKEGFLFPRYAAEWGDIQLLSYLGWEEREVMGYVRPRKYPKFPDFPVVTHWRRLRKAGAR